MPETLRDPVCVFYLVLRALDTVEDDMAVPVTVKVPLLRAFHEHCGDTSFTLACGYGPYVDLMKRYPEVAAVFSGLEAGYAAVIADITRRMGAGMADFIEKEGVDTVADYDLYCHYVAGLVGIGLSDVSWLVETTGRALVVRPPPPPSTRSSTLASCCAPAWSPLFMHPHPHHPHPHHPHPYPSTALQIVRPRNPPLRHRVPRPVQPHGPHPAEDQHHSRLP